MRADRLLLEFDDERSGGFEPLRDVREETIVVLGLVGTKTSRMESVETLVERIREAERIVPRERLAISPQCGFASSVIGNQISSDVQAAKLRLVGETARRVWA